MKKFFFSILFGFFIAELLIGISFARDINLPLFVKSKYFSVYANKDIDITAFLSKLHFEHFTHIDNIFDSPVSDRKDVLAKTLDGFFLEVSDILDIHIYSFHGNIKIVSDSKKIQSVFRDFFGMDFNERAFYAHENNTIYVSFSDLTLGMLGHEIAHAIQSHYFVVPPPVKIQEVLSGYVEYNLRKSTGTLN